MEGVIFIQASVLSYAFGKGIYDTAVCWGNPITDFPHQDFPQFRLNQEIIFFLNI
jgi:hypothetical protein